MLFPMGSADRNGQFESNVSLPYSDIGLEPDADKKITSIVFGPDKDSLTGEGAVRFIPERGISIISDIDDTLKISEVLDKKKLIKNTFLLPYKPVMKMSILYKRLDEMGSVFHYVSASPWQFYPALSSFLQDSGFPEGILHLKQFGLSKNAGSFFQKPESYKIPCIKSIIDRFPKRRFIFIGDTGERDPEIYAKIKRAYPEQITFIALRNVDGSKKDSPRFAADYKGLTDDWVMFDDPSAIYDALKLAVSRRK
jgi:phosphatidate phosphatase APP1